MCIYTINITVTISIDLIVYIYSLIFLKDCWASELCQQEWKSLPARSVMQEGGQKIRMKKSIIFSPSAWTTSILEEIPWIYLSWWLLLQYSALSPLGLSTWQCWFCLLPLEQKSGDFHLYYKLYQTQLTGSYSVSSCLGTPSVQSKNQWMLRLVT